MPIYEYECEACGNRFELIQKFSDPLVEICPKCGERKVHKLLSSPAFQFKGTGWYVTDYARKGSGGPESSKSGEASEKKSDDKSSSGDKAGSDKSGSAASSSGSSSSTADSSNTSSSSTSSSSSGTSSTSSSTDKASPSSTKNS